MNSLSNIEHKGFVHLYSGTGKGKTTAAAGLAVRALGAGKTVLFCQFLKGRRSCELDGLKKIGAEVLRAKCGEKFISRMDEAEKLRLKKDHEECFDKVSASVLSGRVDLAVLDEIVDAVNFGLINESDVLGLIENRPPHVEIVMTGHNPDANIKSAADYETDFVCVKHPFARGVAARAGIEY